MSCNQQSCQHLAAALKQNATRCGECDMDISHINKTTRILDKIIDRLVDHYDHRTHEHMVEMIVEGVHEYCEQMRPGHLGNITPAEAGLAIQLRSLAIIKDLQEAVSRHG